MSSYVEQMQNLWKQYEDAGNAVPATTHDVAAWAIRKRLWFPKPANVIDQCAEDLSSALREVYITDRQGRRVRAMHSARVAKNGKQLSFWADIRTAPRSHMEIAFRQRRKQIVGDCKQLKTDVDSYNDGHVDASPIPMLFDFTDDLIELDEDSAA